MDHNKPATSGQFVIFGLVSSGQPVIKTPTSGGLARGAQHAIEISSKPAWLSTKDLLICHPALETGMANKA
jgi:hypothetical protein